MDIRDWLTIIVIIFLVLTVLDGFRVRWLERKNRLVVKLDKNIPPSAEDDIADPLRSPELPNGGARTISRANENPQNRFDDGADHEHELTSDSGHSRSSRDSRQDVPVLMESVELDDNDIEEYSSEPQPETRQQASWEQEQEQESEWEPPAESESFADEKRTRNASGIGEYGEYGEYEEEEQDEQDLEEPFDGIDESEELETQDELETESAEEWDDRPGIEESDENGRESFSSRKSSDDRIEPTFGDQELTFSLDDQGELNLEHHDLFESEQDADQTTDEEAVDDQVQEVIIINVMAKPDSQINGKPLLQVLLKQGMRLGDMSIFHRHADTDGKGPTMFSMANMVKPGTFSMSDMDEFTTPGVSFFMQMPNKIGNMRCFDQMLTTAEALKKELEVVLKDENRSVFTPQTIEHSRQRIRDFELAQLRKK